MSNNKYAELYFLLLTVNEPSQKYVKKKLKREWNLYRNEYQSDSEEDTFEESTKHFRQNSYSEPDRQVTKIMFKICII